MSAERTARAFAAAGVTAALVLAASVAVSHAALEIRHSSNAHYDVELTRAYQECTAPNDMSSGAVPACSPPVTSACDYDHADVELEALRSVPGIDVQLNLRDADGPGSCPTGPYNAIFSMRVTADDATCTSGQCTWIDVDIAVPLDPHFIGSIHNFELDNVVLEDYLASAYLVTAGHVANYEVLGVTIEGPDGLPMAGAGIGNHSASQFRSDVTARYEPACTAPDTTNQSGVPACSAPTWGANCDFTFGEIRFREHGGALEGFGLFSGVVGGSPLCSDGTYVITARVRATDNVCSGLPCTLIDMPVSLPVDAVDGEMDDSAMANLVDLDNGTSSVEIRETFLQDPLGENIASPGVTNAFLLDNPTVKVALRDPMNPTDDRLTLRAKFPHPPIDPTVGGATFTVTDQNGIVYSVTIPAGAWETVRSGSRWQYKEETGALAGVRKASIREYKSGGFPFGFAMKLLAKDINLSAADLPSVNLVVSVSNSTSGTSIGMRNATCRIKPNSRNCRL